MDGGFGRAGFRRHIEFCNNAEIGRYLPLVVGHERLGWVRRDRLDRLREFSTAFEVFGHGIRMTGALFDVGERTAAIADVANSLVASGDVATLRNELYPATPTWGASPRFLFDRALAPFFGLRAYGVHMNGYVRKEDGLHLWIGRRAADKAVAPNMLDNTVAGGQPASLSLRENLIKECAEEANIPREMAERAVSVGCMTYEYETEAGLKPDCMFTYDLEMPADFVPENTDGEISEFMLMSAADVMAIVRETDEFKFNCSLALISFFIRHGLIDPDTEDDYAYLCEGLAMTQRSHAG